MTERNASMAHTYPGSESAESQLPLQYEDGPDYCTVKDAQGRDFALTMQPALMKAMEQALREDIAELSSRPAEPDIEARISQLTDALKSISANTCCDNCREAALVARSALASYVGLAREGSGGVAQGVLMPVEPTDAILDALAAECRATWGVNVEKRKPEPLNFKNEWRERMKPFYRAMLQAYAVPSTDRPCDLHESVYGLDCTKCGAHWVSSEHFECALPSTDSQPLTMSMFLNKEELEKARESTHCACGANDRPAGEHEVWCPGDRP